MNRLGVAVQLCLLRYPGQGLGPGDQPPAAMVAFVADQVGLPLTAFADYAHRDQTRREHAAELQAALGLRRFGLADWRAPASAPAPTRPGQLTAASRSCAQCSIHCAGRAC